MVAELLYLEKQGATLPIEMLINSSGTTRQDGEIVSFVLSPFLFVASVPFRHAPDALARRRCRRLLLRVVAPCPSAPPHKNTHMHHSLTLHLIQPG